MGLAPSYAGSEYPSTFGQSIGEQGEVYCQWHRRDNAGRVEVFRLDGEQVRTAFVPGTQTAINLPGLLSFGSVSVRDGDVYRCRPQAGFGCCKHPADGGPLRSLGGYPSIAPPILLRDKAVYGGLDGRLYVVPMSGEASDGDGTWSFATAFGCPISAGETPAGDVKFSTGIEPTGRWGQYPPPGVWNFYSYWHEMQTKWGTVFNGKQEPIRPGRWYCVEVMLKANSDPTQADGEQAFWIDGGLYGHFRGIRWRSSDALKINSFWLLYYNTDQPARHNKDPRPESRAMQVWFDDVVIATEPIGPIQGKPRGGKKRAVPSRSALLTSGG